MECDFPRGKNYTNNAIIKKSIVLKNRGKKFLKNKKANLSSDDHNAHFVNGTSVLAVVSFVKTFEVHVCLPNGRRGVIAITNISNDYSKLLQDISSTEDAGTRLIHEKVLSLNDIFQIGMILRCTIIDVDINKKNSIIKLSINPKIIHKDLNLKLVPIFTGIVSSCEDHGYILDIGQPNLSAFVIFKDSEKYLKQLSKVNMSTSTEFAIGTYLNCSTLDNKISTEKSLKFSIDLNKIRSPISSDKIPVSIQNILPGTVLKVKVIKVNESQITVSCNHLSGSISRTHLLSNWKSYQVEQELCAVLIYIHPIKRTLILSELNHLSSFFQSENIFGNLSIGDIIDNAEVVSIKTNYGVFLKIPGFTRLFAKWNQIDITKNKTTNFKKGDLVKCRIVNLNYFDRIVMVTMHQDIINQPYFKVDNINIGDIISCQVKKSLPKGLVVSLFGNIKGFVPSAHISNIPLKLSEKKFLPGKKIKCRVMQNDISSQKLILTHKKLLIKSRHLVPCKYDDIEVGKLFTGFVGKASDHGLVVVFFNGIKGWIPKTELSYQSQESPEEMFFVGQVVDCLVKSYNSVNNNLLLTLKYIKSDPNCQDNILKIGTLINCRIIQTTNLGLHLKHNITGITAYMLISHLSDYHSNCDMFVKLFEPNSIISDLMIIENKNNNISLTKKKYYIDMINNENIVSDINSLIIDKLYYGFVKKKMDYGVFVQISGLTGLVLKKDVIDVPHPDPISLLEEGQTIIGKVKGIDLENNKFLITLRLKNSEINKLPIEFLEDFLIENNLIREKLLEIEENTKFKKYSMGDLVSIKITSINNIGVLGVLKDETPAFVINDNLDKVACEINKSYDAVVLYIDLISKTLQLSLDNVLTKAAKSNAKNRFNKILPGQVIKSEVQFVSNDYILVSLKNHGYGQFAFVPARNHLSDFIEKFKFNIGQQNQIVIKEVLESGQILASLEIHDNKNKIQSFMSTKVGDILTATIKKVCNLQINISTASLPGRIHISEITDDMVPTGTNVLSTYKANDRLKVKVIELKHDQFNTNDLLECTIKPSKLNQPVNKWPQEAVIDDYKKGDSIIGYITSMDDIGISVQITREIKGFINFFNFSRSIDILNDIKTIYHVGMACKAWVLFKNKKMIQLTMLKDDAPPKIGDIVVAKILKRFNNHLFLQLPMQNVADTSFNDKNDIPEHIKYVTCKIIKECIYPKKKFIVTLHTNEYIERPLLQKPQLADIQVNMVSSSIEDSQLLLKKSLKRKDISTSIFSNEDKNENTKKELVVEHLVLPSKFNWQDDNESLIDVDLSDEEKIGPPSKRQKQSSKLNKYELDRLNFEKEIRKDPNSSVNWLKYLSFELGNNEVDKARSIAERAITTISFREETAKMNIWIAYMNLESNYGTEDSLQKIVERAKRSCDPFKIQCHLKDIYSNAGRLDEAIAVCQMLIKRHKHNLEAWSHFGTLLYKFGMLQKARELLGDCLQKIDVKDRIEITSRFAQLESKFGVPERGETLLEDIVKNFPKRTDVWSIYADMCIKNGHIEQARQVLEAATNLNLNPKKMKFLFDRYLAFEAKYGNDETTRFVKEKAIKYTKK